VAHDLKLCPVVMDILNKIPAEHRVGPFIIDERAGRPYAEHAYRVYKNTTFGLAAAAPRTTTGWQARPSCPRPG